MRIDSNDKPHRRPRGPRRAGLRRAFGRDDVIILILVVILALAVAAFFLLLNERRSNAPAQPSAAPTPTTSFGTNRAVEPFTLTDQHGETFSSASLDGNYWIANFIFTNCAGPCPIMTAELADIQEAYAEVDHLRYVSISVDPKRDTPERLREFAKGYGADLSTWTFLRGDYDEVQHLAKDVFLLALANPMEETPPGEEPELAHTGDIVHSTRFILVGPDGRIINWFNGTDEADQNRLRDALDTIFDRASTPSEEEEGGG